MKVYRIEHHISGEGPFMGPKSNRLLNKMCILLDDPCWPVSRYQNKTNKHDYYAVRTMEDLRGWFHDTDLICLLRDDGYTIAVYKVRSTKFDDGKQLTFRKERATKISVHSLNILLTDEWTSIDN